MSRPLRLEFKNALYHVTSRGDRQEDIYEDDLDRNNFLNVLASVIKQFNWLCYAYCLMDNHYHLLIQTPDGNLSKGMRQLNGVFTQACNRRHRKTGHLFQGRYKGILVDKDAYLLELTRYLVLNPVKAGLVIDSADWKWSSYLAMTGQADTPEWLSTEYILAQFATKRKTAIRKYIEFVNAGIKNDSIWSQLNNQIYLGDAEFINNVQHHMEDKETDIQIPKVQKRAQPQPLDYYERHAVDRDAALIEAYSSGGYSYQQLGNYFGLHFTTVGRIIRKAKS
jgi:REP element-mobilizing transposase RayT